MYCQTVIQKDVGRRSKVGGLNIFPLTNTVDRKNSCTSWYFKYPSIYRLLYMPGGCRFSSISSMFHLKLKSSENDRFLSLSAAKCLFLSFTWGTNPWNDVGPGHFGSNSDSKGWWISTTTYLWDEGILWSNLGRTSKNKTFRCDWKGMYAGMPHGLEISWYIIKFKI